ncbi:helix-turn-helix transcriptional regulator [Rahnella sp. C60]|uniref:Helix-turn-helix transcriptional regulator n=1 Tax=Rahnella perminowiae TaxID=2816244 RepID=A0ABS6KWP1_9GAMM|nr:MULTISPECIES: helix-turn-helix domain-containing protein [Rahnella]UJD89892.1 helix-turn-helix transcriptional regulator [Rahnella aquatilis]MBU9817985.1 helix-turn-helix transcriptional regulator [Rahnella perminowiae]MBU9826722.1 helix-turn-helix transcriptional regulator [Rahnella perminowiae]MBU9833758.1 helix-turn-helix transcriptional regulator [Rahnella perminowiae]MCX2944643.1 helix-turn-helix domain-containing protein [Rahnella perminowiae]
MTQIDSSDLRDVGKTRPVLENITNKWSILILTVLCTKPSRFNELRRRLEGITHKALSDALKRLERNGLVYRKVLPTSPVSVEYSLTALARTLQEPFIALYEWALEHGAEMERAQEMYDASRVKEMS